MPTFKALPAKSVANEIVEANISSLFQSPGHSHSATISIFVVAKRFRNRVAAGPVGVFVPDQLQRHRVRAIVPL